jgi:hypothetical protein
MNFSVPSDNTLTLKGEKKFEKEAKERFIATTGTITWLTAFSPKGMAGEIDFIFQDKTSIFDLTEANYEELLEGLQGAIRGFSPGRHASRGGEGNLAPGCGGEDQ